eukprot:scaffold346621_cov13-Prasinocladus_malaysianus.AAC.1
MCSRGPGMYGKASNTSGLCRAASGTCLSIMPARALLSLLPEPRPLLPNTTPHPGWQAALSEPGGPT